MAGSIFMKSGGIAALATALAALSMPVTAIAQERGGGFRGAFNQRAAEASAQQAAPSDGGEQRASRSRGDGGQRAQQAAPVARQQQGGERRWQGRGDGNPGWQGRQANRAERPAEVRRERIDRGGSGPGIRGALEAQRDGQWRNRTGDDRRVYNQRGRDSNRWDRNDNRRWDNNWRRDRRYDWSGYRNSNRHVYRIGRYYSPYRNYYYRPLSVGFYLDSLFFGSSYWINDPWQYRLPPAYGPYRWVRYYDDVLLVNIYSGEVVDVIRGFFW